MEIKARPLNGNKKLNRWRFVVKAADGSTVWSSPYCYASEAEALEAGQNRKETRSQPGCVA